MKREIAKLLNAKFNMFTNNELKTIIYFLSNYINGVVQTI